MKGRFYLHVILAKDVDCNVIGWREIGVNAVYIDRLVVDGIEYSEEYRDHLLKTHTRIYREIERKLGMPPYILKFHQPTQETENEHL